MAITVRVRTTISDIVGSTAYTHVVGERLLFETTVPHELFCNVGLPLKEVGNTLLGKYRPCNADVAWEFWNSCPWLPDTCQANRVVRMRMVMATLRGLGAFFCHCFNECEASVSFANIAFFSVPFIYLDTPWREMKPLFCGENKIMYGYILSFVV